MSMVTKGMNTPLLVIGGLAGSGIVFTPTWSGRIKTLVTDSNGNISNQLVEIDDLVAGDDYKVLLSGPLTPSTTIQSAVLYVDTWQDTPSFNVSGTIILNGTAGIISVELHMPGSQTALLTDGHYIYSIVILDNNGDKWTPVNGALLLPVKNEAV